jgi:hypothetical protein
MSNPASSLPDRWIQSLWVEMAANYPGQWQRQFPVPPCPPGVDAATHAHEHIAGIQAVWAKRLGHLQSNPAALRYALTHLPVQHPPSLPEFVALCNRRPDVLDLAALSGPKADPARVQQVIAGIERRPAGRDPLQTLRELAASDAKDGTYRGKPVTLAQRQTYRQALGMNNPMEVNP